MNTAKLDAAILALQIARNRLDLDDIESAAIQVAHEARVLALDHRSAEDGLPAVRRITTTLVHVRD